MHKVLALVHRARRDEAFTDLLRNSGILYAAGVFTIGLTFLQQVTTASLLGPSDYGRFAIVLGSTAFFMLIVDARTWEMGTKLLVRPLLDKDHPELTQVLSWLVLIDLVFGIAGSFLMLILAEPLARYFLKEPDLDWLVRLYGLSIPFRLVGAGGPVALLRLHNHFDWLSVKSVVYALARLVLITGAALLGFGLVGVIVGAVVSEVLNTLAALMMTRWVQRREMPGMPAADLRKPHSFAEGRRLLIQLWVSATLKGLQLETLVPITALMTNPVQVGLLRLGLDIADLINKLVAPLVVVVSPNIIILYEEKSFSILQSYIKKVFVLLSGLTLPMMLGMIIVGPFVLPHILRDFVGVAEVTALLAVGYGINALFMWVRPVIIATNLIPQQNVIGFIAITLTIIGLIPLASTHGALGSALAFAVFMIAFNLISLGAVWYRVRQR